MSTKISMLLKSRAVLKNPMDIILAYKNLKDELATKDGFKIHIRKNTSDVDIFRSIWIDNEYNLQGDSKDKIIVDIGGHIGLFALYAKHLYPKSRVLCFEPNIDNYSLLQLNAVPHGVETFMKAVSSKSGTVTFFKHKKFSGGSIVTKTDQSYDVQSITLQSILEMLDGRRIDLLKLDCEGSEWDIILNTPKHMLEKISMIVAEFHIFDNQDIKSLVAHLEDCGFVCKSDDMDKKIGHLYAVSK